MAVAVLIVGSNPELIQATRASLADFDGQVSEVVSGPTLQAAIQTLRQEYFLEPGLWAWPLLEGMTPARDSLKAMLDVAERSPSAGLIFPKLMQADRPRVILEYGLTVGRGWLPFGPASGQFDQSQHDWRDEFLAANVFGSLIRLDQYLAAGGVDQGATGIANAYRLAVAMRLQGSRIIGAPNARVFALQNLSPISALSEFQRRKAQIQLWAGYRNPVLVIIAGLLAPFGAVFLSLWYLLVKQPERIGAVIGAGFWWLATGVWLVGHRPGVRPDRAGHQLLRQLRATREDFERGRSSQYEQASAIAEAALDNTETQPRFVAAQGLWIMAALAALSWRFWPQLPAVSGGGLLPLGDSLSHLFSRAGASWQYSGFGTPAPSDPFNWVLFVLGATTFWAPSLSVALLVFLAKPLAFASAWRLLSIATTRRWVATLGSLAYAFWPALTAAQDAGQLGVIVAQILLPWFVFAVARILRFGASERRSVQTWTWVGVGAVLAAAVGASAPSLMPLIAAITILLAIYRFRRLGYLIWLPVPLLAIWAPFAWYLAVGLGHPLAILSQPGLAADSHPQGALQLLLGSSIDGWASNYAGYSAAALIAVALLATVGGRALQAAWLVLAYAAAVVSAFAYSQLQFQANPTFDTQSLSNGTPLALLGLAGLVLVIAATLTLEHSRAALRGFATLLQVLAVLGLAFGFVVSPSQLNYTQGSQMPALVEAQAKANPFTRVLVIRAQTRTGRVQKVSASIATGSGVWLEDLSVGYNYSVANLQKTDSRYKQLASLVANLVSANGSSLAKQFGNAGVDFVLLPQPDQAASIASSLASVAQLEAVGDTEFGRLWKVSDGKLSQRSEGWQWSLTKQIQVGVLVVFALLAIPTRRRSPGAATSDSDEDLAEGFQQGGF